MTDNNKEMSLDEKIKEWEISLFKETAYGTLITPEGNRTDVNFVREIIKDRERLSESEYRHRENSIDLQKVLIHCRQDNKRLRAALDRAKKVLTKLLSGQYYCNVDSQANSITHVNEITAEALRDIEAIEKGE